MKGHVVALGERCTWGQRNNDLATDKQRTKRLLWEWSDGWGGRHGGRKEAVKQGREVCQQLSAYRAFQWESIGRASTRDKVGKDWWEIVVERKASMKRRGSSTAYGRLSCCKGELGV